MLFNNLEYCRKEERLPAKQFSEEAFAWLAVLTDSIGKLTEQFFLLGGEFGGRFYPNGEDKVALTLLAYGVKGRYALALDGELGTRLCTLGNGELHRFITENGYIYLATERRLGEGNRYLTAKVGAITGEYLMRLYPHLYDKRAGLATELTLVTLATKDNLLSVGNSRRDGNAILLSYPYSTLAVTVAARVLDYLARTATGVTGALRLRVAEHSALIYGHISRALALRTSLGLGARLGTRAATIATALYTRIADILVTAERRLLKGDANTHIQVLAILGYRSGAPLIPAKSGATRAPTEEG